jgi:uncharacterized protein YuzE
MAAVTYNREGDVLYIALGAEDDKTEGEEVFPGVMLMYDGDNRIIGIEIITSASKKVAAGALDQLAAAAE